MIKFARANVYRKCYKIMMTERDKKKKNKNKKFNNSNSIKKIISAVENEIKKPEKYDSNEEN